MSGKSLKLGKAISISDTPPLVMIAFSYSGTPELIKYSITEVSYLQEGKKVR